MEPITIVGYGKHVTPQVALGKTNLTIQIDEVKARKVRLIVVPDTFQPEPIMIGKNFTDLPYIRYEGNSQTFNFFYSVEKPVTESKGNPSSNIQTTKKSLKRKLLTRDIQEEGTSKSPDVKANITSKQKGKQKKKSKEVYKCPQRRESFDKAEINDEGCNSSFASWNKYHENKKRPWRNKTGLNASTRSPNTSSTANIGFHNQQ